MSWKAPHCSKGESCAECTVGGRRETQFQLLWDVLAGLLIPHLTPTAEVSQNILVFCLLSLFSLSLSLCLPHPTSLTLMHQLVLAA